MSNRAFSNQMLITEGSPPEELFCLMTGGCKRWQIFISITTFISEYFHGLNLYCWKFIAPEQMQYHCVNGTKCHYSDGSKCKKFKFYKEYKMETWNEHFLLVCEDQAYVDWMHFVYRCGLIVSYLFVGFLTDKYGRRNIAMTFIPMLGVAGVLTICSPDFVFLYITIFCYGLFSAQIHVTPKIALCNAVGNKWRSFALGISMMFVPLGLLTLPLLVQVLPTANSMIAVLTMLPLLLMVPLLFTKNSPNWSFLKLTVDEAERSVRKIAKFNGQDLPTNIKICPVNIIDVKQPIYTSIIGLCKAPQTRCVLFSLFVVWFFQGYVLKIILNSFAYEYKIAVWQFSLAGFSGIIVSIMLIQINIDHKIIIMFSAPTACVLIGIYLFTKKVFLLVAMSYFACWVSMSTLENLTPRIFPTLIRNMGMALSYCFCHFGVFVAIYSPRVIVKNIYSIMALFFIFIPLIMIIFAWPLWKVHLRELPDLLEDCINFKTHYKPRRFVALDQSTPASGVEKEVKLVDLGEGSYAKKR